MYSRTAYPGNTARSDQPAPPAASLSGGPFEILSPSGERLPFFSKHLIPLGAALLITEPLQVLDTRLLHDIALASPWAPMAVPKSDSPGWAALIGAWRADHHLPELVVLTTDHEGDRHTSLRRALRHSPPPTPVEVANWIQARAASGPLGAAVFGEIVEADSPCRQSRHTYFVKAGPLRARAWKNGFRLAQALSQPCGLTIDAIAGAVDRDSRTLRAMTEALLGMPISAARHGFGWKWAIELILQRHGYLEGLPVVPIAVGRSSTPSVMPQMRQRRESGKGPSVPA